MVSLSNRALIVTGRLYFLHNPYGRAVTLGYLNSLPWKAKENLWIIKEKNTNLFRRKNDETEKCKVDANVINGGWISLYPADGIRE